MPFMKHPATLDSLRPLMAFVSRCLVSRGFSHLRASEVELAVEEALVNVFRYAYPDRPGEVEVRCQAADDGRLVIEIEDEGVPFNLLSIPDPELSPDINRRKIGGLGVFFIRRMIDDVRYRREQNRNVLTLVVSPERPAPLMGEPGCRHSGQPL